ncbi:MAG: hypothetical protein JL50_15530 [Peptococcaceae bacterium BICA1-7]|nr:MAG: hypothetical protein JL50_15530 [Peptococcaceae bacterium BICA1-7]HBV96801.1 sigma-54-dependent Fis family transcriptional regulator [Desulfotomaculum sp.]
MTTCKPRILIVGEEETIRNTLSSAISEYQFEYTATGAGAVDKVRTSYYQAALVDLILPDINGLEVLYEIKILQPQCQVIIMSGHASIPMSVRSIKMGALDFIERPFSLHQIQLILEKAVKVSGINNMDHILGKVLETAGRVGMTGFSSKEMRNLLTTAYKVAGKKINMLICGETGTGKELLARFIHSCSPQSARIFLPVNCGALAESLVESDLFGHEKGSFTGADRRRHGCFELAHRGTILLDEVGDASPGVQSRLLRVLETGEINRLGGEEIIHVDVRIISATNIDLEKAVQKRMFREDLYYRLSAVRLDIPPLRQRREDIPHLAEYFLRRILGQENFECSMFAPETMDIIVNYPWPGNVRELANVVYQAAALSEGNTICAGHLPDRLLNTNKKVSVLGAMGTDNLVSPPRLKEIEKSAIIYALQYFKGNIKAAAQALGIGRATMHRKLKEYGIDSSKN